MEEAFADYLSDDSGVQAIASDRVDWNIRPQAKNTPAVALHNITTVPYYDDGGFSELIQSRIQVDCWAKTYALAKQLSRAVVARISGNSGKFIHGGINFQVSFKEDEQDSFEQGAAAEDLHRVRLDFLLLYKEEN